MNFRGAFINISLFESQLIDGLQCRKPELAIYLFIKAEVKDFEVQEFTPIDNNIKNPNCPICGVIMLWCSLTIDGREAGDGEVLICNTSDDDNLCPNGWDATQDRLGWR